MKHLKLSFFAALLGMFAFSGPAFAQPGFDLGAVLAECGCELSPTDEPVCVSIDLDFGSIVVMLPNACLADCVGGVIVGAGDCVVDGNGGGDEDGDEDGDWDWDGDDEDGDFPGDSLDWDGDFPGDSLDWDGFPWDGDFPGDSLDWDGFPWDGDFPGDSLDWDGFPWDGDFPGDSLDWDGFPWGDGPGGCDNDSLPNDSLAGGLFTAGWNVGGMFANRTDGQFANGAPADANRSTSSGQIAFEVTTYPNPASDFLRIMGTTEIGAIEVYNLNGARMYRLENVAADRLDLQLAGFESGSYILILQPAGEAASSRIVFQVVR